MDTRGALCATAGLALAVGAVGVMVPQGVAPAQWPLGTGTAAEANTSWPTGFQPPRLGAWSQDATGRPLPCWQTTVLHDHAKGWPGLCMGLFQIPVDEAKDEQTCKEACWGDPRCAVWQWAGVAGSETKSCWIGDGGFNCDFRNGNANAITVEAAQRLQHGQVHVYKSLVGMKINKLYNFGLYAEGSQELSISRCRDWCYSSMGCQYWQYSKNDGCSADAPSLSTSHDKDPTNMVDYPLTSSSVTTGTPEAASVIAGEYLVHYCPPESNQVASSPSPAPLPGGFYQETKENSGPSVPVMVIALLLILAAIGALGYYWMNHKSSRKVSSHARLAEEDDDDDYSPKMASSAQGQYASSAYQQPPSPPRQPAYGGYGQGGYGQGAQAPTMNFQGQSPMPLLNQGAPYGSARGQPYPGHNARLM